MLAPDILVPNAGGAWRRGPLVDIQGAHLYFNPFDQMKKRCQTWGASAINSAHATVFSCRSLTEEDWHMAEYTANVQFWGNIVPCHYFAQEMKRRYASTAVQLKITPVRPESIQKLTALSKMPRQDGGRGGAADRQ